MAVNTRTEYALRALIEMAESQDQPISAHRICERQNLPIKYIERLLALLKNAGLVHSMAGSQGGYTLARAASEICFLDILKAVEDGSFSTSCSSPNPKHCLGHSCALMPIFNDLDSQLSEIFASYSLEQIFQTWKRNLS
jgi:Rrf2 family protein